MSRSTWAGVALLLAVLLLATVGPLVSGDPLAPVAGESALAIPSLAHLLGTDQFARDIFARLAFGARVSLTVGSIGITSAAVFGLIIGLCAGSQTWLAQIAAQAINLSLALPRLVVLLVILAALGRLPVPMLGLVLGASGWPPIARLVRGETLRLRHARYVEAARAIGASPLRMLFREILPAAAVPAIIAATLGLADAILLEAGLSFIGIGVRPPTPSWGSMLFEAREYLASAPWLLLAPSAALVVATSAATLLGDGLRRSLQPEFR